MAAREGLELSSYDRFFPNQDVLPKGGFGNLIALPLQKACRALGNTEFLDPVTLQASPDQWAFLSETKRLSPDQLNGFLQKLPPVAVGLGSASTIRKSTVPEAEGKKPFVLEGGLRKKARVALDRGHSECFSSRGPSDHCHRSIFGRGVRLSSTRYPVSHFPSLLQREAGSVYRPFNARL